MRRPLVLALLLCLFISPLAISADLPVTDGARLTELSQIFEARLQTRRTQDFLNLITSQDPAQLQLTSDPAIELMFFSERGHPVFYQAYNLNAARTVNTDNAWPGGGSGLGLDGAGTTLGELAVWDAGGVRSSHQEFTGRVTQMDSPGSNHYHATHVAGTMIAAGVDANAKGMSPAATLAAYDWTSDDGEMASAAALGMHVSNHSYGFGTGWYQSSNGDWYWYGDINVSLTEDYGFGFYDGSAQSWDQIAHNAPYYSIVKSAGNDRNDFGPGPGGTHFVWSGGGWQTSTTTRDQDGGADGYDCISYAGTAKNIITVGAVNDIPSGYSAPGDVVQSSFSGWGPTDDGRIKPDIVGNGVSLRSTSVNGDTQYDTYSGTSMSSPNVAGSINLLVRHFESTHSGTTPLASTVKGVIIHTADEAGPSPGPDYMNGWGLLNTTASAELIDADGSVGNMIIEDVLANNDTTVIAFSSDGTPITLTLCWTDVPGSSPPVSLNPTTLMLENDLDMRLVNTTNMFTFRPYILNPASPSTAATTGDNFRDNVEKIYAAVPAGSYEVRVTHKGTLASSQAYSLIASTPLVNSLVTCYADTDSDTFGDINNSIQSSGGCPAGYVSDSTDCDDTDGSIYPGAPEIPGDLIDQDCDGVDGTLCYADSDNDTFGDPNDSTISSGSCPAGYVSNKLDCDDTDGSIYPGAPEVPDDGIDQDCDGFDDITCFADTDSDTFGDPNNSTVSSVSCPGGYVSDNTDCDDTDGDSYPGATEIPDDGIDQNCDGFDDITCYADTDSDTFGDANSSIISTDSCPSGHVSNDTDCDDSDGSIYPGAPEVLDDGIDQDCNGADSTCCVMRGDANLDSSVDIADLTFMINFMFKSGPTPICVIQCDVDDIGGLNLDIADITYMVEFMFKAGAAPVVCPVP